MFTNVFGHELRLEVKRQLVESQVCKTDEEVLRCQSAGVRALRRRGGKSDHLMSIAPLARLSSNPSQECLHSLGMNLSLTWAWAPDRLRAAVHKPSGTCSDE